MGVVSCTVVLQCVVERGFGIVTYAFIPNGIETDFERTLHTPWRAAFCGFHRFHQLGNSGESGYQEASARNPAPRFHTAECLSCPGRQVTDSSCARAPTLPSRAMRQSTSTRPSGNERRAGAPAAQRALEGPAAREPPQGYAGITRGARPRSLGPAPPRAPAPPPFPAAARSGLSELSGALGSSRELASCPWDTWPVTQRAENSKSARARGSVARTTTGT